MGSRKENLKTKTHIVSGLKSFSKPKWPFGMIGLLKLIPVVPNTMKYISVRSSPNTLVFRSQKPPFFGSLGVCIFFSEDTK